MAETIQTPSLLHNRDYMFLWSGQVVSVLGSRLSEIVFPLLAWDLTGSPIAAGILVACYKVPLVLFSLPAGALIDRWDRKRAMMWCDTLRCLAFATIPVSTVLGALTIWQLFIVALIEGTLSVFFNVAQVAALPRVVQKEQLPEAGAQNQATTAIAEFAGPGLGTTIYQFLGQTVPFVFDSISYALSVVSLFFIKTPFQEERAPTAKRHLLAEIREGLAWLWGHSLIRFVAFLTGGVNLVFTASEIFIIALALHVGANKAEIGFVFSIGSIGAIVGAAVAGRVQKRFAYRQVTVGSVWIMALLFPLYAIAPNVIVLGAVTALAYFTAPVFTVTQLAYRLPLIPDQMQGRVNSTYRLIIFGFQPIGALLGGYLVSQLGPATAVLAFSAWLALLAVVVAFNPEIRGTQSGARVAPEAL